jgi:Tfp pilus assembly protein PilO
MKIQNRQQLLVIIAAACVLMLAGNWFVWTPLVNVWKTRAAQVAKLRTQIRDGTLLVQREQFIRSRWTQMQGNTLLKNPSLAEQQLFKDIDDWADRSRASLTAITPQWKHDPAEDFTTLDCRLEAAGDLGTVSRFLYELERDPLAVRVQSLELAARDNSGQQFTLNLQVSALMLNLKTP